jgi:CheY-like chemotaxis protein
MGMESISVLIVEDNAHMRTVLLQVVRAVGVGKVLLANDGAQALQTIREQDIDILITDLAMEPFDGIDLIRLIRNSPSSAKPMLPVLMITGHMTLNRVQQARDAGVTEFLSKPISVKLVMDRLEAIIFRPRDFIRSSDYFGPDRRRRRDPGHRGPFRRKSDQKA